MLFGELLPELAWHRAESAIAGADVVIAIGTSGSVWPAAGLLRMAKHIISVNTETTEVRSDIELIGPAAEVVPLLLGEPT